MSDALYQATWGCTGTASPNNRPTLNLPCSAAYNDINTAGGMFTNASARSGHVGGVFTLFCDGHVQFIANDVESFITSGTFGTWQKLAWIDDGQRIDPDKF